MTGAGRGFGRAIAERFTAEGAAVALLARSVGQLAEVVAVIESAGGTARAFACDVTDPAAIASAVAAVEADFGPVDLLINNAGIAGPFGPAWQADPEEWWRAQEIHIRAHRRPAIDPGFVATQLAMDTINSDAAQKHLPGMVERLKTRAGEDGGDDDLAACAQRCLDLASGRYDLLSGGYYELPDDLDEVLVKSA